VFRLNPRSPATNVPFTYSYSYPYDNNTNGDGTVQWSGRVTITVG